MGSSDGSDASSFGELLKRYRTAAGMTQEDLAGRAGMSARGVQDLERGIRRSPHPETTRRLAEALGLRDAQRAALQQTARQHGIDHGAAKQAPAAAGPEPLQVPLTPLIGREREVDQLSRLLQRSDVRLVTLLGPAGIGKTRLALAVANAVSEAFSDGAAFVDLAPVAEPSQLRGAIAYALGLREAGRTPVSETLRQYLQDRHLVLILDNFEHLLEAASAVAELLSTSDRLKMLVTSRSVLHVYGEHIQSVPPLELPPAGELLDAVRLARCGAIQLFVERIQANEPSFVLTPENAPLVDAICRRLDGLPLALELAASRVRLLPLGALLARLERRLVVLVGGARNLPPRQQTLRDAIDWSYGLLGPAEQALFRRLGVFVGGITLAAADAVCMRHAPGDVDVLELMGELVDASLIVQEPGVGGEPRFRLLETLHEYALVQLAANRELDTLRRAHAEYFVAFAEQAEQEQWSPDQRLVWNRLTEEHDNLLSAIRWCVQADEAELGMRAAGALHQFWHLCGHIGEGRAYAAQLLALQGARQASIARANALYTAGDLARLQADFTEARERWTEQLAIGGKFGDQRLIAYAHTSLGILALDTDDLASGRQHIELALALCAQVGDRWGEAICLHFFGEIANRQRDWATAQHFLQEALAIQRELGDPWGIAHERWGLGYLALRQGDYPAALASFDEALAIEHQLDRKQGVAHNLLGLAWVALEQSQVVEAERLFVEAIGMELQIGRTPKIAEGLEGLAAAAAMRHQAERALRLWGAVDAIWESVGHRTSLLDRARLDQWIAPAHRELGEVAANIAVAAGRTMSLREAVAFARH